MTDARDAILEGLNVFRALEAWGATLYARWAEHEADAELRTGHLVIAEAGPNALATFDPQPQRHGQPARPGRHRPGRDLLGHPGRVVPVRIR